MAVWPYITSGSLSIEPNDSTIFCNVSSLWNLSPAFRIPDLIRNESLAKTYVVLYDTIPFKFAEFNNLRWGDYIRDVFESSNKSDFFFTISKCAQRDFEQIFPLVNEMSSLSQTY